MIKTLTSLRLIFALMVFGAHAYVIDDSFDSHLFKEGFVGVSFFFVLSGFIIAYNYQKKFTQSKVSKRSFFIARFARIYPLHWLTLFIAIVLGSLSLTNGFVDWLTHFLASFTLTQAFIPKIDYFFSFNSPSWSLCCEQFFYLSFPFLITRIKSPKRLLFYLSLCAILMLIGMSLTPDELIRGYWYVNPITRFPDFMVGILLFFLYDRLKYTKLSSNLGTVLEVCSVVLFLVFYIYAADIPKVYRYSIYYWLPVSGLLLVFAFQKGLLSKLLSARFLIVGGEISYSFYLIHLFIINAFVNWQKTADFQVGWIIAIPTLLVITISLSLLLF